jgi:hypothetical protein
MKTIFISLFMAIGFAAQAQNFKLNTDDLKEPMSFGHTILSVAKEGTAKDWKQLLSKEFSSQGDGFVEGHFSVWKAAFQPLFETYPDLEKVPVRLEKEDLLKIDNRFPVIVLFKKGRYYINER